MAELEIRGVTKSFDGRTRAVDRIDLRVEDGEIVTILGPSGCGKSTLLRLIAGLERCDGGEIRIGGRAVESLDPRDRDVAMVFQSYALYPHMRVRENIAVPLRLRGAGAAERERRVGEVADRFGLSRLLQRWPRELSGGERQRVALARALVRSPQVFLLDEPLSNLDAQLRERARGELREIFRQVGAAVVYVTHDQVEAMTLSHRVAVMNAGRIEQTGAPEDLYRAPSTLFVAGFVGTPRMNLIEGPRFGDRAAWIGIRPEDISIEEGAPVSMRAVEREPLGSHHLVHLCNDAFALRVLVPSETRVSPSVRIRIPPDRVHRFDERGARIDG